MEKVDKANSRAKHAEEELGIPPIIACDVFLYRDAAQPPESTPAYNVSFKWVWEG